MVLWHGCRRDTVVLLRRKKMKSDLQFETSVGYSTTSVKIKSCDSFRIWRLMPPMTVSFFVRGHTNQLHIVGWFLPHAWSLGIQHNESKTEWGTGTLRLSQSPPEFSTIFTIKWWSGLAMSLILVHAMPSISMVWIGCPKIRWLDTHIVYGDLHDSTVPSVKRQEADYPQPSSLRSLSLSIKTLG